MDCENTTQEKNGSDTGWLHHDGFISSQNISKHTNSNLECKALYMKLFLANKKDSVYNYHNSIPNPEFFTKKSFH